MPMVRPIWIEFNQQSSNDLDARVEAEQLTKSTIVCRAVNLYRLLAEAQDNGGQIILRISGVDTQLRITHA